MAKTIKFNLKCNNHPIRTIEDLQNNFVIEDILSYYQNGLLHRWLEVRNYREELDLINDITSSDPIELIKELIHIFKIDTDEKEIERSIYALQYEADRQRQYEQYIKNDTSIHKLIESYKDSYEDILNRIENNPTDLSIIKSAITEILSNYHWIFELDYRNLFDKWKEKVPLFIICLLMNEQIRPYMEKNLSYIETLYWTECKSDFDSLNRQLGGHLKRFYGNTHYNWEIIEDSDKQYLIIDANGYFTLSSASNNETRVEDDTLTANSLKKYTILNGIKLKTKATNVELRYMEV